MKNKIENAIRRHGMEDIFDGAVLGFSGGADSGALLHFLKDKCKNLMAVHVNHMIRGAEADRDEALCRALCEKYGVPLTVIKVDIPALSLERKKGLEETAREERYRIFNEILQSHPEYKCILTAHNANDNAETVIFNLVRGSGARGLCGISPVNGNIFRPLIYATRHEIISYCQVNNIEYAVDSTNFDDSYTRNRIRHNVLPQLLEINPAFLETCFKTGDMLRADEEYIHKEAEAVMAEAQNGRLSRQSVENLHGAVLARALKLACPSSLDYKSVTSCAQLVQPWQTGKMVNLANGVTFKVEHSYCQFIKTQDTESEEFLLPLELGVNCILNGSVIVAVGCSLENADYVENGSVTLNSREVVGQMIVRSKRDGDTVKSGGVTKKLKRVFCDKHIPSHERPRLPVICDENGVLAVPGIVARDGAFNKRGDLTIKTYIKK